MHNLLNKFTQLFPLWVTLGAVLAWFFPQLFIWYTQGQWITVSLGVIMLGMGLTLKADDFKGVLTMPWWVITGVALQFIVMPALGWSMSKVFDLSVPFTVGLILVSCCPGGTASNVIAFLAKANVALSVTMTTISTCLAIGLTPFLTGLLVGNTVDVNEWGLFKNMLQVVLIPVLLGVGINTFVPKVAKRLSKVSPSIAVLAIVMIVSAIIGKGQDKIAEGGWSLVLAVLSLHALGFALGYGLTKWWMKREDVARTVSIEVGMQNSGLGAHLAKENFANPVTAIPAAISALTHCIYGSLLAWVWGRKPDK